LLRYGPAGERRVPLLAPSPVEVGRLHAVPDLSVALGLALLDVDRQAFCLDLTPAAVVRRRTFWGKTVFAAAAGVVLFLGLWIPYRNAEESRCVAEGKRIELEQKLMQAKKVQKAFDTRKNEVEKLRLAREYYAQQARLGPVYLNLFARIREYAPRGLTLTYLGPRLETGLDSSHLAEPLRELAVRGHYDTTLIGDFEKTLGELFGKLMTDVPGLAQTPRYNTNFVDTGLNLPPDRKGFEFELTLSDPKQPLDKNKPRSPSNAPPKQASNRPEAGP
jgi:hypothetical protein